jgi:hypothetical protein
VRSASRLATVISVTTTAAFLASCSGTTAPPLAAGGTALTASFASKAVLPATQSASGKPKAAVYISSEAGVFAYARRDRSGNGPVCTLSTTGEPFGMGVDPADNLWVALNNQNAYSVQEYAPNCGKAEATLSVPGYPSDIAFDGNGTAYVSLYTQTGSGPGAIAVYPSGATSPSTVLTDPSLLEADYVAVDGGGDVFAATYLPTNDYGIVEFPGATMPGTVLPLSGIGEAGSLFFDRAGNLLVDDIGAHPDQIEVFRPPYSGAPARTFPLENFAQACILGQHEERVYCGSDTRPGLDVYAYPSGKYLYSDTKGAMDAATGIATFTF